MKLLAYYFGKKSSIVYIITDENNTIRGRKNIERIREDKKYELFDKEAVKP